MMRAILIVMMIITLHMMIKTVVIVIVMIITSAADDEDDCPSAPSCRWICVYVKSVFCVGVYWTNGGLINGGRREE